MLSAGRSQPTLKRVLWAAAVVIWSLLCGCTSMGNGPIQYKTPPQNLEKQQGATEADASSAIDADEATGNASGGGPADVIQSSDKGTDATGSGSGEPAGFSRTGQSRRTSGQGGSKRKMRHAGAPQPLEAGREDVAQEAKEVIAPPPEDLNYAWVPPVTPIEYGVAGLFSVAVSYSDSAGTLQTYLLNRRVPALRPDMSVASWQTNSASQATFGVLKTQNGTRIRYIQAELECSSTELVCPSGWGSPERLDAKDPALWEWSVNSRRNEDGSGLIQIHFRGGNRADGKDFAPLQQIPPMDVTLKTRSNPLQTILDWLKVYKYVIGVVVATIGAIAALRRLRSGPRPPGQSDPVEET